MTAPFAPPPPPEIKAVLICILAVGLVIPFGRREDWLGSIALAVLCLASLVLWGLLIRGLWLTRGRSGRR